MALQHVRMAEAKPYRKPKVSAWADIFREVLDLPQGIGVEVGRYAREDLSKARNKMNAGKAYAKKSGQGVVLYLSEDKEQDEIRLICGRE